MMCLNKVLWLGWFSGGDDPSDDDFTHMAQGSNQIIFAFSFLQGLGQLRRALLVLDLCLLFENLSF